MGTVPGENGFGGRKPVIKIPLKQYRDLLVKYLRPQWPWVVTLTVLLFGGIVMQLVLPQIMRSFIDTTLADGAVEESATPNTAR